MKPFRFFLDRFEFKNSYLADREAKALKILRVLEREVRNLSSAWLLDIGCSQGQITAILAEHCALTVGVDVEFEVRVQSPKVKWLQADGCQLPFGTETFDIIVMNHVIEHVISPQLLLREVWRVLKPEGTAYLACPSRVTLIEPHYRLPFLSWLPRSWADCCIRALGRGEKYEDNLPSRCKLRRMTQQFRTHDLTLEILLNPGLYFPEDRTLLRQVRWLNWLPKTLLGWILPMLPVIVFSLKKCPVAGECRPSNPSDSPVEAMHVSSK